MFQTFRIYFVHFNFLNTVKPNNKKIGTFKEIITLVKSIKHISTRIQKLLQD